MLRGLMALGLLAVMLVGCGSGSPAGLSLELEPQADFEAETYTFTASGEAVEDGVMCDSGAWIWVGNETADGEAMPGSMIEEMVQAGGDFTMVVINEFACEDGSGSIVVAEQSTIDASNPAYTDPGARVGTWVVRSGSINGDRIEGGGDVIGGGDMQVSGQQSWLEGSLTGG